jgi:alpha-1,6-mannosyltransferase
MQLKIADVSEFYAPEGGGVKTYVHQKFVAAKKHGGIDLTILAPGAELRTEEREGGRIIWVPAHKLIVDPRYYMWGNGDGIRAVLDNIKPDIVECSSPWRGGWVGGHWQGDAIKTLIMHADPVAVYPQRWLEKFMSPAQVDSAFGWFWNYLRKLSAPCDATIVAGDWFAKRCAAQGLRNPIAVPLGVETELFGQARANDNLRAEMLSACGLPESATLLITLGRFHGEKRVPMLIEAVGIANRTRPIGLFVIGDGMGRKGVEACASKMPQVHLAGAIKDRTNVAMRLASADGLLHGSASETFGYVVAESLCAGLPIIVPDRGGAADFAGEDYAEIYATGNASAAAAAILRLAARPRAALKAAALHAGKTRVSSADDHFTKLFDLYAQLVAAKRAGAGSAARQANS